MYDINGKQLERRQIIDGEMLDVRGLQNGVYLLEIEYGQTVRNFRFVKE